MLVLALRGVWALRASAVLGHGHVFRGLVVGGDHFVSGAIHDEAAVIEPDGAVAELLDGAAGVGDDQEAFAGVLELQNLFAALGLEGGISNGEDFIDDEEGGVDVDGDGEGETHHHAGGVGAEGFVDEVADTGELYDLVVLLAGAFTGEAEEGGVEEDILAAGEVAVEAGAEFEECGDAAVDSDIAFIGVGNAGDEGEECALAGAVAANDADGFAFADVEGHVFEGVKGGFFLDVQGPDKETAQEHSGTAAKERF